MKFILKHIMWCVEIIFELFHILQLEAKITGKVEGF